MTTEITDITDQHPFRAWVLRRLLNAQGFKLGALQTPRRRPCWLAWLPLLILPVVALTVRTQLPSWAFMWLLAWTIYFGFKWLTFYRPGSGSRRASSWRVLAYLFAWPGMDAKAFLDTTHLPLRCGTRELLSAVTKMVFGGTLLWGFARIALPHHALVAGWIGMVGLAFLLHFGLFHVLALLWQRCGVDAHPLMVAPLRSCSLGEFWGRRWNLAFRDLAYGLFLRPVSRSVGIGGATVAIFLASGVLHDLVISLPSGAGFGLPTAYFSLQGLGLLFERSSIGRRWMRQRRVLSWFFTFMVAAVPAYWLFHPPFVMRVMLPFMNAIGAL